MTEVLTDKQARASFLDALAAKVRSAVATLRTTTLEVGDLLHEGAAQFTATESAQFMRWAMNVTGWSDKQIRNVMNASAVVSSLSRKAQREKVAKWSIDSIVSLAPVKDPKDRQAIVSAISGTSPAPQFVRETRDSVLDRTPSTRTRQNETDRTLKLAESIRELVERNAEGDPERFRLIVFGAQLALDNGKLTPAAVQFIAANPAVAESDES